MGAPRRYACRRIRLVVGASWRASLQIGPNWLWGRPGHVAIDDQSIYVEIPGRPALQIPRSSIRAGFRVPQSNEVILLFVDGARATFDLEPGVPDPLDQLRMTLEKSTLAIKLRRTGDAMTVGGIVGCASLMLVMAIVPISAAGWELWLALPVLLAIALSVRLARGRIVVGTDGVLVRGLRERFIPFDQVASIDDLSIVTTHGKRLQVAITGRPDDRAAALHRLHEAFAAYRARRHESLDALRRGERSLKAWKEDLAKKARATATFRSAATSKDDFEAVLDNPTTAIEERLGAAVALASLGDAGVERVRIAAQSSVNERVRIAFEAAADGHLEEEQFSEAVAQERMRTTD
jgi:hypothetical protein